MAKYAEFQSPRGADELTITQGDDGAVIFETVNGDSADVHVVYLGKRQVQELTNLLKYWRSITK